MLGLKKMRAMCLSWTSRSVARTRRRFSVSSTSATPLRVCVVGTGPSGFYTARTLCEHDPLLYFRILLHGLNWWLWSFQWGRWKELRWTWLSYFLRHSVGWKKSKDGLRTFLSTISSPIYPRYICIHPKESPSSQVLFRSNDNKIIKKTTRLTIFHELVGGYTGLVRYGVAPDHPETKNVITEFEQVHILCCSQAWQEEYNTVWNKTQDKELKSFFFCGALVCNLRIRQYSSLSMLWIQRVLYTYVCAWDLTCVMYVVICTSWQNDLVWIVLCVTWACVFAYLCLESFWCSWCMYMHTHTHTHMRT